MPARDCPAIARRVSHTGDRQQAMLAALDTLWEGLKETRVSWLGVCVHQGSDELMVSAP
jgi:hypothetical protein